MKSILWVLCIAVFFLQETFSQSFKKPAPSFLTGSWSYKSGHYIYFDSHNRKLKQSKVTDIHDLKIEVTPSDIKIIYPNQVYNSSYVLSVDKRRQFISFDMGSGLVKYQILYTNSKFLTLRSTHSINFYVDGDPDKKAAYSIFVINFIRSG